MKGTSDFNEPFSLGNVRTQTGGAWQTKTWTHRPNTHISLVTVAMFSFQTKPRLPPQKLEKYCMSLSFSFSLYHFLSFSFSHFLALSFSLPLSRALSLTFLLFLFVIVFCFVFSSTARLAGATVDFCLSLSGSSRSFAFPVNFWVF